MQIVIASHNVHKIREFRAILKPLAGLDVLSLIDFPDYHLPPETGATFEENATQKAVDAAKHLNKWVLADDSGLVVPALQGAPGVVSARYAGPDATDAENRKKLLADMRHLQEPLRQAYFECWIALASPLGIKKVVRGICEGTILDHERGSQGFGYDPIFIKHEYGKTFAEMDESIKNRVSHRRKAFDRILPTLETLLASEAVLLGG
ncbi:MAG: RdgB/HAM1 family non-canonical purine NTP pyrophosphatase [Simkania sp.]|nr:RdgB/HAM1 family non-canonical purine NTP pyrophosphatase [Simkania sp.]